MGTQADSQQLEEVGPWIRKDPDSNAYVATNQACDLGKQLSSHWAPDLPCYIGTDDIDLAGLGKGPGEKRCIQCTSASSPGPESSRFHTSLKDE